MNREQGTESDDRVRAQRAEALDRLDTLRARLESGDPEVPVHRFARRLRAVEADRFVTPGSWPVLPLADHEIALNPLPMRPDWWRKLYYTPVYDLGVTCTTGNLLRVLDISTAAELLLRSESELQDLLAAVAPTTAASRTAMEDVQSVLEANKLRLATDVEWAESLQWDFHRTLTGHQGAELRVATFMLTELPMAALRPLFDERVFWPYEIEGLVEFGQVLNLTSKRLDELWRRIARKYVDEEDYSPRTADVAALAEQGYGAMTSFIDRNGLSLGI